mmetsp:Transcript_32992/g.94894  ORF Transcript_32992/g.94894 Transcript_32992/m.94894 type:complete len:149 (+) Transcript_32992:205-651(+)
MQRFRLHERRLPGYVERDVHRARDRGAERHLAVPLLLVQLQFTAAAAVLVCLCFKDCSELTYPSKEVWETMNPEEAKATSDSSVSATVVIAAIAAFAGLLVVTTAVVVCYIRHHRRIRAATSLRDTTGNCAVHESAVPDPETNRNAEV